MKKSLLNLIAVFFISVLAFANTYNINNTQKQLTETIEIAVNDDAVLCYRIGQTQSYNSFTGLTTITTYYRCVELGI